MTKNKWIAWTGIAIYLFAQCASAELLNSKGLIYGATGSERGNIVKELSGSYKSYHVVCDPKGCRKVMDGYLLKPSPELSQSVATYLKQTNANIDDGLEGTRQQATIAIAKDIGSTSLALAGHAAEANPLLGSAPNPATLIVVGLARHMLLQAESNNTKLDFETRARNMCLATGVTEGAAANNLMVLASGAGPISLIVGWIVGQARVGSCLKAAHQARALAIHQENMALLAYANGLKSVPANTPERHAAAMEVAAAF